LRRDLANQDLPSSIQRCYDWYI